jgi:hypothetical protein
LKSVPTNQLGRYSYKDILKWHRIYISAAVRVQPSIHLPQAKQPLWLRAVCISRDFISFFSNQIAGAVQGLTSQKKLLYDLCVTDDNKLSSLESESVSKELHINKHSLQQKNTFKIQFGATGSGLKRLDINSKPRFDAPHDKLGEIQGSERLATWQRAQVLLPVPSTCEFTATFTPDIEDDESNDKTLSSSSRRKNASSPGGGNKSASQKVKAELKQQKSDELAKFKASINVECFVWPKEFTPTDREKNRDSAGISFM